MLSRYNDAEACIDKLGETYKGNNEIRDVYVQGKYFTLLEQDYQKVKIVN